MSTSFGLAWIFDLIPFRFSHVDLCFSDHFGWPSSISSSPDD
jgi:hypothetical protein